MAAGVSRGTQPNAGSVRRRLSRGSGRRGRALGGVGPARNTALRARDGIPVVPVSGNCMSPCMRMLTAATRQVCPWTRIVCSVLQLSGESRVEVLDFNAHISRVPTTAEKLAATCLGIDPEQPPDGARLVCEPSVFPADLVFANEVVTSLPYYAVPAPGQHEPYIGYMMDEQRLLGVKVCYRASCIARDNVLMSDLNPLLILGWVIRLLCLLMETWGRSMFTRFKWTRCMSRSQQCCDFTLRRGRHCIFPQNAGQA